MRNLLILLLLFFTTANAQRQRYDGYMPTTGDSHTRIPDGATPDRWQNLNSPSSTPSIKYTLDLITNNLLSHLHNYPIVNFKPKTSVTDFLNLPDIQSIRIIDGRYDVKKVGFFPCDHSFREKQLFMVGLQLQGNLTGWLKENFIEKNIHIDSTNTNKRQLVILLKKYWYSLSAAEPIASAKNDLIATLHYRFDIFSSKDIGYYPIKKIEGTFSGKYSDNKAYNYLTDSLLLLLKNQFGKLQFEANEIEKKWIAPADFVNYCNIGVKSRKNFENKKRGLYESYQDFLDNKPIADSVDMITKYSNSGTAVLYACQIAAYQNSEPLSGTKAWGFFDGETIFLNTGNGFYIKLLRSGDDYLFLFLRNMGNDKIKAEMQKQILINDTPYKLLKNFTASYSLIYQLDFTTGKLF